MAGRRACASAAPVRKPHASKRHAAQPRLGCGCQARGVAGSPDALQAAAVREQRLCRMLHRRTDHAARGQSEVRALSKQLAAALSTHAAEAVALQQALDSKQKMRNRVKIAVAGLLMNYIQCS